MRKTISLWMLGIVAMLASCSQDETLQDATSHKSMTTITATISDGMKTRATPASDDELAAIQRCKLVVYNAGVTTGEPVKSAEGTREGNNFTFSLDLDEGNYDFYCWADDGTSYNLDNGLGSITVATTDNKPGIAHEGKVLSQKSGESVTIPLQHAVAKVVLQTTANITADKSASVTVQTHTGYSVFDGKVAASTSSITETKAIATTDATVDNPAEVLSFYVLVDKNEEPQASVTVAYDGDAIEVANVPIKADYRTILKGDLTALAYPATTVTATLDTSWENDTEQAFTTIVNPDTYTITLAKAGALTEDDIRSAMSMGYGMGALKISGPMNDNDIQTLSGYLKTISDNAISLQLTNASFESLPAEAFKDVKWLTWIYLPSTLKTIGNSAFEGCARLAVVAGLENVETVGSKAFKNIMTENTINLISFSLNSATSIGAYAFQGIGGSGEIDLDLLSEDDIDVTDAFKTEGEGSISERIVLFLNETKKDEVTIVEDAYKIWKGYTFDGIGFTTL